MLQRHDPDDVVRALLDTRDPSGDPIVNAVRQLMTGFGYNFYDAKNVARANDQLVRAKAAGFSATPAARWRGWSSPTARSSARRRRASSRSWRTR